MGKTIWEMTQNRWPRAIGRPLPALRPLQPCIQLLGQRKLSPLPLGLLTGTLAPNGLIPKPPTADKLALVNDPGKRVPTNPVWPLLPQHSPHRKCLETPYMKRWSGTPPTLPANGSRTGPGAQAPRPTYPLILA